MEIVEQAAYGTRMYKWLFRLAARSMQMAALVEDHHERREQCMWTCV